MSQVQIFLFDEKMPFLSNKVCEKSDCKVHVYEKCDLQNTRTNQKILFASSHTKILTRLGRGTLNAA